MLKTTVKFGILAGIFLILWDYLLYNYLYVQVGYYAILVQVIIIASCIFFGIKEAKNKRYEGDISYKNASLTGFIITLYAAVLFTTVVYYFYPYGNLNFERDFVRIITEKMKVTGRSAEEIKKEVQTAKEYLKPHSLALGAFYNTLIIGVIFTLIFSSILRKRIPFKKE